MENNTIMQGLWRVQYEPTEKQMIEGLRANVTDQKAVEKFIDKYNQMPLYKKIMLLDKWHEISERRGLE